MLAYSILHEKMKRLTCIVHGKVQGVNYRDFVHDTAIDANLTGTVQNLADGTVEVIAEGEETILRDFLSGLSTGYSPAKAETIDSRWTDATGEFTRFRIVYRNFLDRF